jgi:hypothetical protein
VFFESRERSLFDYIYLTLNLFDATVSIVIYNVYIYICIYVMGYYSYYDFQLTSLSIDILDTLN